MSEQQSSTEKCPTCGTTTMRFFPPVYIPEDNRPRCGVLKPGNYGTPPGGLPECELGAGHEGRHAFIVEYLEQW